MHNRVPKRKGKKNRRFIDWMAFHFQGTFCCKCTYSPQLMNYSQETVDALTYPNSTPNNSDYQLQSTPQNQLHIILYVRSPLMPSQLYLSESSRVVFLAILQLRTSLFWWKSCREVTCWFCYSAKVLIRLLRIALLWTPARVSLAASHYTEPAPFTVSPTSKSERSSDYSRLLTTHFLRLPIHRMQMTWLVRAFPKMTILLLLLPSRPSATLLPVQKQLTVHFGFQIYFVGAGCGFLDRVKGCRV